MTPGPEYTLLWSARRCRVSGRANRGAALPCPSKKQYTPKALPAPSPVKVRDGSRGPDGTRRRGDTLLLGSIDGPFSCLVYWKDSRNLRLSVDLPFPWRRDWPAKGVYHTTSLPDRSWSCVVSHNVATHTHG
jgi:hypothetical protein